MKIGNRQEVMDTLKSIDAIDIDINEIEDYIKNYPHNGGYDLQCATKIIEMPKDIFVRALEVTLQRFNERRNILLEKLKPL